MTRGYMMSVLPLIVVACSATDSASKPALCTGPERYVPGGIVVGTTFGPECRGPEGPLGQLYSLTLTQQTNLQFTVVASGFPGFIGLYTSSGGIIERNNSDLKIKAFLPAGSYQLFVNSTSGAGGTFTLTSPPTALDGCSAPNTVTPADIGHTVKGASFSGIVTAIDCGNTLSKTDIYEVWLTAGTVLNLAITVDRLSGLNVTSPSGSTAAAREMPASGTWTTAVTAETTGRYLVRIESRTVNGSANLPVAYSVLLN